MAFVNRSKRFNSLKKDNCYYVDYYIDQNNYDNIKANKINSKIIKNNDFQKNKWKNLRKLNKLKDKEIEIKQNIINEEKKLKEEINNLKKYNCSNAIFKSKTSKSLLENKNNLPGPGDYEIKSELEKKLNQINKENILKKNNNKYKIINKIKNYPSIPRYRNMNLPVDNNDTENDEFNNSNYYKDFDENDYKVIIGPGSYNIEKKIGKGNFVNWKKPKEKKLNKIDDKIGPGYYDLENKSNNNNIKEKSSSFFLNSVPKNTLPNEIIQRNNKKESNIEFIKDSNPGPGYYYNPNISSSIKIKNTETKFQEKNFGIKRFSKKKFDDKIPDPGYYNLNDNLIKKSFNVKNKNFNYNSKREDIIKINSKDLPGPGQYYNIDNENDKDKKLNNNYKVPFNSSSNKIENIIINENIPGPGSYFKNEELNKFEDYFKKESSFFKGNMRFLYNKYKNNNPGPDKYDIIQKKEVIKNNKPFNKGEIRFKKEEKVEPVVYENKCEEILHKIFKGIPSFHIKINEKITEPNFYPFNVNENRFNDNHIKEIKQNNLGPGFYNIDNKKIWNKKSYNKLFNN